MSAWFREVADSPEEHVRLWMARIETFTNGQLEKLSTVLSGPEQERAARFHFERDRRTFVVTRGLLRNLLGAEMSIPPNEVDFEYGPNGKPTFASERALRFNVSHSADRAMFALARNCDVGIDLEANSRIADEHEMEDLATRILSPRERAIWSQLRDPALRRAAFFRAWTRKEAFAKARGKGIFDRLTETELILDAAAPEQSMEIFAPENRSRWMVHDLAAPIGFSAALAVEMRA